MNSEIQELCERLVPAAYIQQGVQARRIHENKIRHFLQQVSYRYLMFIKISLLNNK